MTISKNLWKLAALLLVMCLISAALISGTLAKYTDTYAGEDTALVAKWEVTGSGADFKTSGSALTLDLFQHTYDTNVTTSDGATYIIAPGVQGDFTIEFDNNSDVAAKIIFDIAETAGSADVPIVYSFTSPAGITFSAIGLETALNTAFEDIDADPTETASAVTQNVYWSWVFDGDDAADTALGIASADAASRTTYGLTITASAVQVMPE